ncbi:hypothetical protein R3P38DRAFT_3398370 [Favolaschia claudopus]|uniref:Myb/SANT-like domain-containing protein n=1 Tax=Favolaschia claudopus TaxID=2862362 RepID=A0AAW0B1L4_9AGAR
MARTKNPTGPSATAGNSTPSQTSSQPNADWSKPEIHAMLDHLILPRVKAQAGDGGLFPMTVFTEVSAVLAPLHQKGGLKTAKVCHNKYTQLRGTSKVVEHVAGNSGWAWSDEHGACIDDTTKSTWDDYVRAHPKAKPFRNRGWEFRDKMLKLMPVRITGAHVYRGTAGAPATLVSDDEEEEEENDGGNDEDGEGDAGRGASPPWDMSGFESQGPPRSSPSTGGARTSELSDKDSTPQTPAPSQGKKCSAATPVAPTPVVKKPRGAPGAAAMDKLATSIVGFGEDLRFALAPPEAAGGLQPSPRRKMDAIVRAQELEASWLPTDQLIRFINILKADRDAVDTYSALKIEELRKAWVRNQLGIEFEFDQDWLNNLS